MITIKQWREFKSYRYHLIRGWIMSKEYSEIDAQRRNLSIPIKEKFLFWNTESMPNIFWQAWELARLSALETLQKPYIPPETVEGCLDWLSKGSKL